MFIIKRIGLFIGIILLIAIVAKSSDRKSVSPLEYRAVTRVDLEQLAARKDSGIDGMRVDALVDSLNKLAVDGWELVAIEPSHSYSEKAFAPATVDGKVDSNVGLRGVTVSFPVTYIFKKIH
jgi:hypothetical protein